MSHVLQRGDRGAALVTVLLFMVLIFMLITTMLVTTGNEIVISGLHRDSVIAFEYAESALQEALRRIEMGRPYVQEFSTSVSPRGKAKGLRRQAGVNSAYLEVQAEATVGRASRRISALVLQRMVMFPPNITFGRGVTEFGQSHIASGDVYASTWVQFRDGQMDSSNRLTYAGWRISRCVDPEKGAAGCTNAPAQVPPCYTHAQCVSLGQPAWWPGHRRSVSEVTPVGAEIKAQTSKCPEAGGGFLPADVLPPGSIAAGGTDISGRPVYGFDRDDRTWQETPIAPQAVSAKLPCGLPYKWVQDTFRQEKQTEPEVTRYFKTIVFEQWMDNYWDFDESKMTYKKKSSLETNKEFGAVPPPPDFLGADGNADQVREGGGMITQDSGVDFGCKHPEMLCPAALSRPALVFLKGGDWTLSGNIVSHGTIVVDGNLQITGNMEHWGTIIVNGTATVVLGAGNVKIHGGMVASTTVALGGNTLMEGGTDMTNVPIGRSVVIGKAWWER